MSDRKRSDEGGAGSGDVTIKRGGPATSRAAGVPEHLHATLRIERGAGAGTVFALRGPVTVIGRGDAVDVRIDDKDASREHAAVTYNDALREFRVKDMNSSNGTLLNGSRVASYALRHGDKLLIGETLLVFEVASR